MGAVTAVLASVAVVALAAGGGEEEGGEQSAPRQAAPAPRDASLDEQLNALERAVRAAGRE